VYKLKEMDEKFRLFRPGQNYRVLDLGASPGSWSLYVLRRYGNLKLLAAADMLPLSRRFDRGLFDRDNFFFIRGDFSSAPVKEELARRGPYGTIISDAAPDTSGTRSVDALRSLALAEEALAYAGAYLAPGGNLALKVFQGGDTAKLFKRLKEGFLGARAFKPAACRRGSFEIYYIGLGKKDLRETGGQGGRPA
jgi:23S rRNA (uridine2552-2'-O)-methyltransferase